MALDGTVLYSSQRTCRTSDPRPELEPEPNPLRRVWFPNPYSGFWIRECSWFLREASAATLLQNMWLLYETIPKHMWHLCKHISDHLLKTFCKALESESGDRAILSYESSVVGFKFPASKLSNIFDHGINGKQNIWSDRYPRPRVPQQQRLISKLKERLEWPVGLETSIRSLSRKRKHLPSLSFQRRSRHRALNFLDGMSATDMVSKGKNLVWNLRKRCKIMPRIFVSKKIL